MGFVLTLRYWQISSPMVEYIAKCILIFEHARTVGGKIVKKNFGRFESIFNVCYLALAVIVGCVLIGRSDVSQPSLLAGMMALTLGLGDAFHLVPRVLSSVMRTDMHAALGFGKLVTSITMTVFYVLLWIIGLLYYHVYHPVWTVLFLVLTIIRLVLCLLPQNEWLHAHPPVRMGILRNIPFFIMGIMVVVLFWANALPGSPLEHMGIAVLLSFAFYAPVVCAAHRYSKIGMLMAPKTCMYIWVLWMCLSL